MFLQGVKRSPPTSRVATVILAVHPRQVAPLQCVAVYTRTHSTDLSPPPVSSPTYLFSAVFQAGCFKFYQENRLVDDYIRPVFSRMPLSDLLRTKL